MAAHLSKQISSKSVRYPVSNKKERDWRRLLTSASGLHTYLYTYRHAHAHTPPPTHTHTLMNMYMYIPKCPSLGNDSLAEVFRGSREASTIFFGGASEAKMDEGATQLERLTIKHAG